MNLSLFFASKTNSGSIKVIIASIKLSLHISITESIYLSKSLKSFFTTKDSSPSYKPGA